MPRLRAGSAQRLLEATHLLAIRCERLEHELVESLRDPASLENRNGGDLDSRQRVASPLHALAVRLRAQPGDRREREARRRGRDELLQLCGRRSRPAEGFDLECGLPVARHGQVPDALAVLDTPPEDEPRAVEAPAGRVVVGLRVGARRQRAAGKLRQLEVLARHEVQDFRRHGPSFPQLGKTS